MILTTAGGGGIQPRQHLEGAGLQRVAGQDRYRFSKGYVACGLAAAQVVVIQRRQVVVDEGIGVQHFQGRAQALDPLGQRAGNGHGSLHGENRPQPLAPGKNGVAHGAVDRGRDGFDAGNKRLQRSVRQLRAFL